MIFFFINFFVVVNFIITFIINLPALIASFISGLFTSFIATFNIFIIVNFFFQNFMAVLFFVPLFGAFLVSILPNSKFLSHLITLTVSLKVCIFCLLGFVQDSSKLLQYPTIFNNSLFHIDGITLVLIVLTALLTFLCVLISLFLKKFSEFGVLFLIIESLLIGVWCSLDILTFFILFETILIPMFLLINLYGSRARRIRASYMFFMYTLFGSVCMLLAILFIASEIGSTDLIYVQCYEFASESSTWLWIAFFISFASKIPMVPLHIWLPEAHVEAPTSGSVLLAGILLKLGGYGFFRFSLNLFPSMAVFLGPFLFGIGIISILYASITAIRQNDLKRIIAYASIAHMNLIVIGFFSFNQNGIEGATLQMLSHGFISSALFLCIGMIYDRFHTRLIKYLGGLCIIMPKIAIIFLLFSLGNIAFPGTSSFMGEFLILGGIFVYDRFVGFLSATGIILSGIYTMWLYNRVAFGNTQNRYYKVADITKIEAFVLLILFFFMVLLGVKPEIFLGASREAINLTLIPLQIVYTL